MNTTMTDSNQRCHEDYQFSQLLIIGDSGAWDRFYDEFRKRLETYIRRTYPDTFGAVAIEEIFDGVGKRLIENDYRALREYRGECSFSTYITRATEWEIRDWLRKHSDELMNDSIDTVGNDGKALKASESFQPSSATDEQEDLPDPIKSLNDDVRFAFLLRYYDYFGFPFNEIRLLARKKGVSIGSISERIVMYLDPSGQDVLGIQREKQKHFHQRLEKLYYAIHKLNIKEHKFTDSENYVNERTAEPQEIRSKRSELERKRDSILKEKSRFVITTPYEAIAEILGDDNVSTIRSRVFLAKKQLAQKLSGKDG